MLSFRTQNRLAQLIQAIAEGEKKTEVHTSSPPPLHPLLIPLGRQTSPCWIKIIRTPHCLPPIRLQQRWLHFIIRTLRFSLRKQRYLHLQRIPSRIFPIRFQWRWSHIIQRFHSNPLTPRGFQTPNPRHSPRILLLASRKSPPIRSRMGNH